MVDPGGEMLAVPPEGVAQSNVSRILIRGEEIRETRGTKMQESAKEIPEEKRDALVATLNARLADGIDLMMRSKLAHWHVEGPDFYALHTVFDRVFADVTEHVDLLAERAVQLGGRAHGAVANVAQSTNLPPYEQESREGRAHLSSLTDTLMEYSRLVRRSVQQAEELGDQDTAEIFSGVSRDLETHLVFLQGHLERPEEAGA
jgi:starvation-inducible DNA-binding protein